MVDLFLLLSLHIISCVLLVTCADKKKETSRSQHSTPSASLPPVSASREGSKEAGSREGSRQMAETPASTNTSGGSTPCAAPSATKVATKPSVQEVTATDFKFDFPATTKSEEVPKTDLRSMDEDRPLIGKSVQEKLKKKQKNPPTGMDKDDVQRTQESAKKGASSKKKNK